MISLRLPPTATIICLACCASAGAMDSHTAGPRALGLGGAGTAAADDHMASWYNPAIYGFFSRTDPDGGRLAADPSFVGRKDWGVGLFDAGLRVELRGRMADYVERVAGTDLGKLSNLGSSSASPDDLKVALTTADLLRRFAPATDNALVQIDAGVLSTRVLHVGLGLRQFAEAMVSVADLDRSNLGFGTASPGTNIVQELNAAGLTPSGWTSGHAPTLIAPGSQADTDLRATLAAASGLPGTDPSIDSAISRLDYAAGQAGLGASEVAALAASGGLLNLALAGTGDISSNQTAIFTAGFAVAELPLTIGWAINDHIAFGANLKLMIGQVAAAKMRLAAEGSDGLGELLSDAFDGAERSVTGGIDVGVAVRDGWWQAGLMLRNLNRPEIAGATFADAEGQPFTVEDIPLDPQAALGVAVYPTTSLCLTADLDLTRNRTVIRTVSGRTGAAMGGVDRRLEVAYESQRLGGGIEWRGLAFLELRLGASHDLAEDVAATMLHGGVGLNLWLLRCDLGGAVATEEATVDGQSYPRAAALGASLAIDF